MTAGVRLGPGVAYGQVAGGTELEPGIEIVPLHIDLVRQASCAMLHGMPIFLSLLFALAMACSAPSGSGSKTGGTSGTSGTVDSGDTATVPGTTTSSAVSTPWELDHLYDIEITLDPDDWDTLRNQSRNTVELLAGDCQAAPFESPYTWFIGDVLIDGEPFEQVELRKKGLVGSASTEKPGLRLDFDDHIDGQRYLGAEHLTLNNGVQDPSLLHQCLAYGLFADAGYPASRCAFARVSVNDQPLGIYVSVEPVKKPFLRDHFGDDSGALFEGTLSDFRDGWSDTFDPDTDAADTDRSAIDGIVDALDASDDELLAALDPVLDIDAFQTYRALEALVGQWDGYTGNTNNFYIYDRPEDARVVFLPWGVDAAFSTVDFFGDGQAHVFAHAALPLRVHGVQESRDAYENRLRDLIDTTWDQDLLLARVDQWSTLIAPYVSDSATWEQGVDTVRTFIADQPGVLLAELDAGGADLSNDVLKGSPCLVQRGTVSATFSTSWGSSDSTDWWNQGMASLQVSWDGQTLPFIATAAVAGWADGSGSGDELLGVAGAIDKSTLVMPYFLLPTGALVAGTSLDIDWNGFDAYLGYAAAGVDFNNAAYLYGGQLQVDQAGTDDGDLVSGSFMASLWGGAG